jgi:hypothetical protein
MTLEDRSDLALDFARVLFVRVNPRTKFCLPQGTSVAHLD